MKPTEIYKGLPNDVEMILSKMLISNRKLWDEKVTSSQKLRWHGERVLEKFEPAFFIGHVSNKVSLGNNDLTQPDPRKVA